MQAFGGVFSGVEVGSGLESGLESGVGVWSHISLWGLVRPGDWQTREEKGIFQFGKGVGL